MMPSVASKQANYYAAHHRRQSSQSQSSLPDQIKSPRPQIQASNRSLVYLPSTAYSQPNPQQQTNNGLSELSRTMSGNVVDYEASPVDPRDFYRPYQDSHEDGSPGGFHQEALRTSGFDEEPSESRRRKSSAASAQSQDSRGPRSARSSASARQLSIVTNSNLSGSGPPKTLTSRKASFRDLVARFDSSPDDLPPMPAYPASLSNSRKNSPVVYSNPHQNSFHSPRKLSHDLNPSYRNTSIPMQTKDLRPKMSSQENNPQARPLFGEVVSGGTDSNLAGYGIINARRRRGSEGSPMHSPNPMFPDTAQTSLEPLPFHTPQARVHDNPGLSPSNIAEFRHRRANSDFSSTSTISRIPRGTPSTAAQHSADPQKVHVNRMSGSKIPVSSRRQSLTSESGPSNPSSRAASKLDHHQTSVPPPTKASRTKPSPTHTRKSPPRRTDQIPAHIQSPGRQGRNVAISQGEKSPSLRANIIAPPPKISPPLRGSRHRLPVSSATTAASRARMAERFQAMAREQSDKRSAARRARPPELTDVDLHARRLKITQALSRSREGQDLRADITNGKREVNSRPQSTTPSASETSEHLGVQFRSSEVPALVVQSPILENDDDVFQTPTEDASYPKNSFTHGALRALDTRQDFEGVDDSPTLGQTHGLEPGSAVTQDSADTISTPIDAEPQADGPYSNALDLSMLTQITSMREQDFDTPPSGLSRSGEQSLDRTDAESVQLFLRNTTYNMDEDEAVAKGYRDFLPPPPLPKVAETSENHRSSWTSSIADGSEANPEEEPIESNTGRPSEGHEDSTSFLDHGNASLASTGHLGPNEEAVRSTAADDAYTIVNIVVQEQSTSGVVDQQLVDDIYQRILSEEPQITKFNVLDDHRVVELCLRELDEYSERVWGGEANNDLTQEPQDYTPTDDRQDSDDIEARDRDNESADEDKTPPPAPPKDLYPPPSFRTHRNTSSLDSAEDWADTSPSVVDWMQFALNRGSESEKQKEPSPLAKEADAGLLEDLTRVGHSEGVSTDSSSPQESERIGAPAPPPRLPSHSPPPPPAHGMASIKQTSFAALVFPQTTLVERPRIPRRVTSLSQISTQQLTEDAPTPDNSIIINFETEHESPEQKKVRKRRYVLKEIVDTEFTYERDLRVLCDIYKQTAKAALTEDDVKVLFGNVDTVQEFAKDFLASLKQVAKPAYIMERQDKRKELTRTPTSTSDRVSIRTEASDMSDSEKDRHTRIGQAFETSIPDMETVYKEYIRGRHAANQRLAHLQTLPGVREWLQECSVNSSDITAAWSLDALLVKPIQRITKYPLLLSQLLESTAANHPDYDKIREAHLRVTEINIRINEVKKHTEIVDQVLNRKRKESDVRAGLTKAFGRRAEKLRQHVGINEMYEDGEYARVKMDYDNNCVHLMIVSKDCQGYIDSVRAWVVRMCEMAAAAEAWLDVGHSNHPEAESKLRQLAMAVRGISSLALPDHGELVMRKVIQPMEKTLVLLERFKVDPKGLLQKREKKILDYNQAKNKKDRGEKLDRKMTERMEQWEAINVEAKQRMRRLLQSTTALVQSCLGNLVQLHMAWLAMVEQKLATAMAIRLEGLEQVDLVKEWQVDYDFQHAFTMTLGICNGALLAEAMNLMSFLTPGSTLNDEDSPRQSSWNSGAKRSISMNSEADSGPRYSNSEYPPEESSFGRNSARNRAASLASGRTPHTPDMSGQSTGLSVNMPNGGQYSRPGTSPGRSEESNLHAPRVSLDAPSPSLGLRSESPARPGSASTFFSAAPGPSSYTSQPVSGGTRIFSSAMPLSDSPEMERNPGVGIGEDEPDVLFTAASVYEFNIDRARQEGGIPYLTYVAGEIFDVIGERGELWLARNQDDPNRQVGWIWNQHFAKLAA